MSINISVNICSTHLSLDRLNIACGFYFAFGFVAVVGNGLIIVSLRRSKLVLNGGYMTLVHLSSTDVMTGLINVFYTPWAILYQRSFDLAYASAVLLTFSANSRKYFNAFMALTQFYSVYFPIRARRCMSSKWYGAAIRMTWLICVLTSIPLWVVHGYYFDYSKSLSWTFNNNNNRDSSSRYWVPVYGLIINISVTCIIIVLYPACFWKIHKNNCKWKGVKFKGCALKARLKQQKQQQKILILFSINACVFVLYWLPTYLMEMGKIYIISNSGLFQEIMRGIDICYDPFLYYFLNANIRRVVKRTVFCKR